jgi:hypothetical protein
MRPAIHPREILAELDEIAVTQTELARQLRVPANRISQIIQGKRRDHWRHRPAARALVRQSSAVLVEFAGHLRLANGA